MGSKETIPESDAESVLDVIDQILKTGTFDPSRLPGDPEIRKRLDEILATIGAVQDFALCISKGDLDCRLDVKGVSAGSLKFLHSNLRHLTWQAQQIAAGDFSQRVDFMGDFSEAFNHMVMALDAARAEMKQRELELSTLNAQLLTEVTVRRQAEEALRLQNRIFETIAEGVYLIQARDGVIVYTNSKFEMMFGYEKGELIGKHVSVVNAPEEKMSPRDTAEEIMKALNEKHEWRGEVKNIRKDGTTFWCLAVVSTFEHPEFGSVWISAHTDITDRKQAEEALERSYAVLKGVVESPKEVVIFALDRQYRYIAFNENHHRTMKQIWGADIALGNSMPEYIRSPDDRKKAIINFDRALSGESFTVVEAYGDTALERRWYEDIYNPITDENGNVIGLTLFLTDITERKLAEEELRHQAEIIDQTHDSIITTDLEGTVTSWNKGAERLYGYTTPESLGRNISFIYPDDEQDVLSSHVIVPLREKGSHEVEVRVRRKTGENFYVHISLSLISDETGTPVGMIGYSLDITDRKRAEEEERLTRERFETLVKVSEMRNASETELSEYVMEAACRMTGSTLAFIGTMTLDESVMDIISWSKSTMQDCRVAASPIHFPVQKAGIWADAIRTCKPVIVNDYSAPYPGKKGLPEGHVRITRFLSLPILDNGKVVMVAAVANKPDEYDDADVTRLMLLMQGVWGNFQKRRAEEALRESRQILEAVLNTITVRVFWKDKNLVYLGCNTPFARDAGFEKPEDIIGKDDYAMGWREQAELYRGDDRTVIGTGKVKLLFEEPQTTPTGEKIHLLTSKVPLRDASDEIIGVLGTYLDITALKRAEDALKESEQKFREIFDNANDAIEIVELLDSGLPGRFLDLNDVACRMVLYKKEEMLQLSPLKIDTDYYNRPFDEIMRELHTSGHATFETEHRRKDGILVPVEINAHKITLLGKTVFLSIVRDITERKKAEAAILQSEQKFRDIFNNTTDAIHIHGIGDDGRPDKFTDVNDVACRMLGYTKEEMLAKTPLDLSTGYHNPPIERVFEEQRSIGSARFETEHRRKDGTIIPVEVNTHVVTIEGKKVMLGVVRDITERKKTEALLKQFNEELEQKVKVRTEELNASLDEKVILLREVHHRVKNNLQILISLLNLQSRTISDPKVIAALKESTQRIRAMSMVHEKLYTGIDLAHIEFVSYLSSLANSQVSFYGVSPGRIKLEIKGGNIMLDINTAIPLGLVMNELVSNALKHAFPDDRKGTIKIDAREMEDRLEITFADDGIGVPEESDATTSLTLGLRLVNILVEQLFGTIMPDRAGAGTVYHISIPMKER